MRQIYHFWRRRLDVLCENVLSAAAHGTEGNPAGTRWPGSAPGKHVSAFCPSRRRLFGKIIRFRLEHVMSFSVFGESFSLPHAASFFSIPKLKLGCMHAS